MWCMQTVGKIILSQSHIISMKYWIILNVWSIYTGTQISILIQTFCSIPKLLKTQKRSNSLSMHVQICVKTFAHVMNDKLSPRKIKDVESLQVVSHCTVTSAHWQLMYKHHLVLQGWIFQKDPHSRGRFNGVMKRDDMPPSSVKLHTSPRFFSLFTFQNVYLEVFLEIADILDLGSEI